VIRCAVTEKMTVPDIRAQIAAYNTGYTNIADGTVNSGFWTWRIAYRTQRITVATAREEGDTTATLLVPAKPLDGAPLIVWGHGSTGVAEKCAPSRLDLTGEAQDQDYPPMLYRLAGYGYTVIAPDYSGYSYGQPPGYFNAEDEAHAILDATRAAAKLLPAPPSQVVFVGHSQGGHAVLSAQSYAGSYGMQGTLIGVVAVAPFWLSMSLWGAATTPLVGLTTATDTNAILYSMEYAYSAGELREGTGHGVDVFQLAKQAAAKDTILGTECYDKAKLQALGDRPVDFYDTTYVSVVGGSCALDSFNPNNCLDALAAKWKGWWIEDRPPISATAPLLVLFGGMDTTITPARAQCDRNRFMRDGANVTYCYNPGAMHRDLVRGPDIDYANQWIAAKAGVGDDPGGCTPPPTSEACPIPPSDY
jgi:pimeloyl-ACP methyl ester carboxylesterase